jgi:uncharacterized protein DUF5916/cellulose/xylan binding protein with CBM9 domain
MRRGTPATFVSLCALILAAPMQAGAQTSGAARPAGQADSAANPVDYSIARFERVVSALRVQEPITIDGKLSEPAWSRAEPATHFTQWNPHPGQPASYDTDARFLYDDNNLYVGVRCADPEPGRITVLGLEREFASGNQDGIGIFLDSLRDGQTGFYFATNPVGAHHDFQSTGDDTGRNNDWEGVWDVKVTIDDEGWIAEFIIPFKTLRFSNEPNQEWGLNLMRRIRRYNEDSHWAPLPRRYRVARSSMAGTLTGLQGIRQGRNLKVKPYAITRSVETSTAARNQHFDGGLDVKYGVTEAMTLDLGYRTDFSQVEADQQQVNLTRFNLFFPEKRDFFLENSGIFGVANAGDSAGISSDNVIPFFSRRIGLSDSGTPIPIQGGARLSGKVGAYDIGVLGMKTRRDGALASNDFLVGRIRRTFHGRSTLGAFATSRSASVGNDNRLFGVDSFLRFFEKLEVSSYWMKTDTENRPGRSQARRLGVAWRDDDWTVSGEYEEVQPQFNPEVGFVRRGDTDHSAADLSWRPRPRGRRIRNYTVGAAADHYVSSATGELQTDQQSVSAGLAFQNGSTLTATGANTFDRLTEPFLIQSGVSIAAGDYQYANMALSYSSDQSRRISGSATLGSGEFWDGYSTSSAATLNFKPDYHLSLALSYSHADVRLPQGEFTTTLLGAKMLYGFTSKIFLFSFLQYNATTHQFSANSRFNIIHRPLSDLFVVYNERHETTTRALLERSIIVKFTNLFDF